MDVEEPKYGWYERDLIVLFILIGIGGIFFFILGVFSNNLIGVFLIIIGTCLIGLFLWPSIGLTVLNFSISNDASLDERLSAIRKIKSPQIIDVGCGTGRTAIKIAKLLQNEGHLIGIDIYKKIAIKGNSLETVRKNAEMEGVAEKTSFQFGSAISIPFKDEKFDIVNFSSVLHELHMENGPTQALKEAYRVLKSGGYLYVGEWDRHSLHTIAYLGIFCFVFRSKRYWESKIKEQGFENITHQKDKGFGIYSARKKE